MDQSVDFFWRIYRQSQLSLYEINYQNPILLVVMSELKAISSNWYEHGKTTYAGTTNDTVTSKFCLRQLHTFYVSNVFFNSASALLNLFMNWAFNVAQVLLNMYKHHHTETLFIFSVFVSMTKPMSLYVVSMWSISHFYFHFYD